VSCGKFFHGTPFLVAVVFNGQRVHLLSEPMITFLGGMSKAKFSSLRQETSRN
jgi:hypothetical protein